MESMELISSHPAHLIRRLQQIAVSIFVDEAAAFDITPAQFAALMSIYEYPGIDQLKLSYSVGFDRTTIAGVVERLESKGLIQRYVDAHDRRARLLQLTPAGQALVQETSPLPDRIRERLLRGLTQQEAAEFERILAKLVDVNNEASRVPVKRMGKRAASKAPRNARAPLLEAVASTRYGIAEDEPDQP